MSNIDTVINELPNMFGKIVSGITLLGLYGQTKRDLQKVIEALEKKQLNTKQRHHLDDALNTQFVDHRNKTILMWAAGNSAFDLAILLVEAGAGLDIQDSFKDTALMYTAKVDDIDVAQLLLKRGAAPGIVNNNNQTAKDIAIQHGFPNWPNRKEQQYDATFCPSDEEALGVWFIKKLIELLKSLLEKLLSLSSKIPPYIVSKIETELAHLAGYVAKNELSPSELDLLKTVLNMQVGEKKISAIMWAIEHSQDTFATALINIGLCDLNLKDVNGDTALIYTAVYDDVTVAGALIDAHADQSAKNNKGQTAKEVAQASGLRNWPTSRG